MLLKLGNKSLVIGLLLLIFVGACEGQINWAFLNYLSTNELQREEFTYIHVYQEEHPNEIDSAHYLLAKYYLQYGNDSLFFFNFRQCETLYLKDSSAVTLGCIRFLNAPSKWQTEWFTNLDAKMTCYETKKIVGFWKAIHCSILTNEFELPENFSHDYCQYKKYLHREPSLAAIYSALVPGLGRYYAGRKHAFFPSLLMNVSFDASAYEAIHKLGPTNLFSIFSIGVASAFYLSTIYGSYHDLKAVRKEREIQLCKDASNYYHYVYSVPRY